MKWLESCLIAISMYSKIPVPQVEWTKEKMSHAMCFFPLVGAIEGCFLGLWLFIAGAISSICGNEISLGVGHPLSCNRGHPYGRFYGHYGCRSIPMETERKSWKY